MFPKTDHCNLCVCKNSYAKKIHQCESWSYEGKFCEVSKTQGVQNQFTEYKESEHYLEWKIKGMKGGTDERIQIKISLNTSIEQYDSKKEIGPIRYLTSFSSNIIVYNSKFLNIMFQNFNWNI